MKIIKEPEWKKGGRIHCQCGCVFEYSKEDVRLKGFSQFSWPHVICPMCDTGIGVSEVQRR